MKLGDLATLPLTYPDVPATAGPLPARYHHMQKSAVIGRGRLRFDPTADAVMCWGNAARRGFGVESRSATAEVGAVLILRRRNQTGARSPTARLGVIPKRARSCSRRYDPGRDRVYAKITAISRPGTRWCRAGRPITRLAQRVVSKRYPTDL